MEWASRMRSVWLAPVIATALLGVASGQNSATPAVAPASAGATANALLASVQGLETTLAAIPARSIHARSQRRREYRADVTAIERNVSQAVPGLVAAVVRSPRDVGKAFRLYRDVDAVYQVALRAGALVTTHGGQGEGAVLNADLVRVGHELDRLANFIQVTGSAQSAALAHRASQPARPRHLDISNANGPAARAKRRAAKRQKATHGPSHGGPGGR